MYGNVTRRRYSRLKGETDKAVVENTLELIGKGIKPETAVLLVNSQDL
jgi:hypothetical protein